MQLKWIIKNGKEMLVPDLGTIKTTHEISFDANVQEQKTIWDHFPNILTKNYQTILEENKQLAKKASEMMGWIDFNYKCEGDNLLEAAESEVFWKKYFNKIRETTEFQELVTKQIIKMMAEFKK